jgi:hypothetical protein
VTASDSADFLPSKTRDLISSPAVLPIFLTALLIRLAFPSCISTVASLHSPNTCVFYNLYTFNTSVASGRDAQIGASR